MSSAGEFALSWRGWNRLDVGRAVRIITFVLLIFLRLLVNIALSAAKKTKLHPFRLAKHNIGVVINFEASHWALLVMDKEGKSALLDSMPPRPEKMRRVEDMAKLVRSSSSCLPNRHEMSNYLGVDYSGSPEIINCPKQSDGSCFLTSLQ